MGWFTRLDPVSRSDRSWLYWSYCVHAARLESKLATAISSASLYTQQSPLAASKAVWSLYLGLLCPNPMSTRCAGFCSYQVAELGHASGLLQSGHLEIPHKWPRLLLLAFFMSCPDKISDCKIFELMKKTPAGVCLFGCHCNYHNQKNVL